MSTTPIQPIADGLNDNLLHLVRNGNAALGALQHAIVDIVRYRQHQGRPLAHFWGGWDTGTKTTGATTFRMARFDMLDGGCAAFGSYMHVVATGLDISTAAGVYVGGTQTAAFMNGTTAYYPEPAFTVKAMTPIRSPAVATKGTVECVVGFNSVYPMSGCFFEDEVTGVTDSSTTVVSTGFRTGSDIIATQSGSYGTMSTAVDRFMHIWKNRRITYSWFTTEDDYVEFGASSGAYRYIFDQTVGTGGAAPSATGPAITLPHRYSAAGLDTSVRVFVWVYAAMSGTTDGGTIAIANKGSSGTMSAMTPPSSPQTIGGTGFAWYPPLGTFDASTSPYFVSPTDQPFDRICLGARSEGTTDKIRIRAWMMAAFPDRS